MHLLPKNQLAILLDISKRRDCISEIKLSSPWVVYVSETVHCSSLFYFSSLLLFLTRVAWFMSKPLQLLPLTLSLINVQYFPCSPRNITSQCMKNVAFHSSQTRTLFFYQFSLPHIFSIEGLRPRGMCAYVLTQKESACQISVDSEQLEKLQRNGYIRLS